jgi:hypothetical protein
MSNWRQRKFRFLVYNYIMRGGVETGVEDPAPRPVLFTINFPSIVELISWCSFNINPAVFPTSWVYIKH